MKKQQVNVESSDRASANIGQNNIIDMMKMLSMNGNGKDSNNILASMLNKISNNNNASSNDNDVKGNKTNNATSNDDEGVSMPNCLVSPTNSIDNDIDNKSYYTPPSYMIDSNQGENRQEDRDTLSRGAIKYLDMMQRHDALVRRVKEKDKI